MGGRKISQQLRTCAVLEYRSVILKYGVPGLGEVSNYHRETLGLRVRRTTA